MKKKVLLALPLISLMGMFPLNAQIQQHPNTNTDGSVDLLSGKNEQIPPTTVYKILIENAPIEPEYPNLPRFALVGKDNKFYFSVGATIKSTASFDWGNPLINSPALFIPANIKEAAPGNGGDLQMTLKRSKLHFNFVALPGTDNQFGVYVSLNFSGNGNNYGATLQHAYAKYRGFTVGYKNTLYADGAASPYTIDTEGPNSSPGIWNTCIDYDHSFNEHWQIGGGLELPLYSITSTTDSYYLPQDQVVGKAQSVNQRIPDIPMYLQYAPTTKGHFRLTGIIRNLYYRDCNAEKNKNIVGWGLKLSGFYELGKYVTAYYMGQYGRGIASYMQDNGNLGLDLVPSSDVAGELQLTKGWGAYLGLQFNLSKKVFSTLLYSHLRNYMDEYSGGAYKYNDQYQWGQYACANVIYSINPFVQLGLEYLYGRRMNFDQTQHHDNRIQAMFQVTF